MQRAPDSGDRRFTRLGLWYGVLGFLLFLTARAAGTPPRHLPQCPFHALTGLPCPICGATRAGIHLAFGQIGQAFETNPLFTLFYLLLILWAVHSILSLYFKKLESLRLSPRFKPASKLLWVLVILNWVYLILSAARQEQ